MADMNMVQADGQCWTAVSAVGTSLTFLATCVLAWIAWRQLGKSNKTSQADFIERLKNDFFTDKTRLIFTLVNENFIKYNQDGDFFEIDMKKECPMVEDLEKGIGKEFYIGKKIITAYEIDDLLLGNLCDLANFYKEDAIEADLIYRFFGYYIEKTLENEQIQIYVKREQEKWPAYCQSLQRLYKDKLKGMKERDKKKHDNEANQSSN